MSCILPICFTYMLEGDADRPVFLSSLIHLQAMEQLSVVKSSLDLL